jgi:hypothetical protein
MILVVWRWVTKLT